MDNMLTCFEKLVLSDLDADAKISRTEYSTFVEYLSGGYFRGMVSLEDLPLSFSLAFFNSACSSCTEDNQKMCCLDGFVDIAGADGNYSLVCDEKVNPADCEAQQIYLYELCDEALRAVKYSRTELPTALPTVAPSVMQSLVPSVAPVVVPSVAPMAVPTLIPTPERFLGGNITLIMECSMRNDLFVDAIAIETASRRGIAIRDVFLKAATSQFMELVEQSNDDNVNVLYNAPLVMFPDSVDMTLIDRICFELPDFPLNGTSKCANVEGSVVILFPPMNIEDKFFIQNSLEEAINKSLSSSSRTHSSFFQRISFLNTGHGIVNLSSLQPPSDRSLVSGSLEIPVEFMISWRNTEGLTVETILAERYDVGKFMFELEQALQVVATDALQEVFFSNDDELPDRMIGGAGSRGRRLGLKYEKGNSFVDTIVDTTCYDFISDDEFSCGNVKSTIYISVWNEDGPLILEFYQACLLKKITVEGALIKAYRSLFPDFDLEVAEAKVSTSQNLWTILSNGTIIGTIMIFFFLISITGGGLYARKRIRRMRDSQLDQLDLYPDHPGFHESNDLPPTDRIRIVPCTYDHEAPRKDMKSNQRLSSRTELTSSGDVDSMFSSEHSTESSTFRSADGSSLFSTGSNDIYMYIYDRFMKEKDNNDGNGTVWA